MHEAWEQARSSFNHGWLKNQLIAVLLKCRQVEQGLVVNENARDDLHMRLLQWSGARVSADRVIAEVQSELDRGFPDDLSDLSTEVRVVQLANELERQRWLVDEDPGRAAEDARAALDQLGNTIGCALEMLSKSTRPHTIGIDGATLQQLIDAAQRLSIAFSQLTLCRSITEPA